MKVFNYGLQNILDYRTDMEEDEKNKFSVILKEFNREEEKLKSLQEKLDKALFSSINRNKNDVIEQKNFQHYMHFLREKIEIQRQLLKEIKGRLEAKKQEVALAQKERKVMEKLKNKAFNNYKVEMNKIEQRTIDELALYSYMRK